MTEEERKGKTVTETVTEVGTDKSTESEPIRETEKTPYICSLCGAEVVPIEVQRSDGWISYRCPECGKFMKPLTPEDVKEKEEEGKGPLLPDDIAMTERVKELLAEELSTPTCQGSLSARPRENNLFRGVIHFTAGITSEIPYNT